MASNPMDTWPPLLLMVMTGGRRTMTLKLAVPDRGGAPLSVTRTVMVLVLSAWPELGVHVKMPPLLMEAPDGWASSENERFCAGKSLSCAVAVKLRVWP